MAQTMDGWEPASPARGALRPLARAAEREDGRPDRPGERRKRRPLGPRFPAFLVGGFLFFTVSLIVFSNYTGVGTLKVGMGQPMEMRDLAFSRDDAGGTIVRDASNGRLLDVIAEGTPSFVPGAIRGLAYDRRARRADQSMAYRLIHWDSGQLTLTDLATGQKVLLNAFGRDNMLAFGRYLPAPPDRRETAEVTR